MTSRELTRAKKLSTLLAVGAITALVLTACAPGASTSTSTGTAVSTSPGSKQITVTISSYSGGEADTITSIGKLYEAKYPNITIKVTPTAPQQLTVVTPKQLASSNPPDIIRLAEFGKLVQDHLLLNLNAYAKAYGWTKWPQAQFESSRTNGKTTGTGDLYSVGPGFVFQGLFYNKTIAAKIGMTSPPETISELEDVLAKAKAAGVTPIIGNGKDDGVDMVLQDLQMAYAGNGTLATQWVYNKPGVSIDSPSMIKAATTLQSWAKKGYFNSDVNSSDQSVVPGRFQGGEGLFYGWGSWAMPGFDSAAPGAIGFVPFPQLTASSAKLAPSANWQLGVSAKSKHPNAAVSFLNYVYTNEQARELTFTSAGFFPAGPTGGAPLSVKAGTSTADGAKAWDAILADNGLVPFFGNATGQISASTLDPQIQLLLAGQSTPEQFASTVQSQYETQIAG